MGPVLFEQFLSATIENERHKFDFFKARGTRRASLPVKPSMLSRYALLARTLFAQCKHKYDSIRIIARKPGGADETA